jgi:hypothetical protein
MTPLLHIFMAASEAERKRYAIGGGFAESAVWLCLDQNVLIGKGSLWTGTHADCENFIAEKAAVSGFRAVRDAVGSDSRDYGLFDFFDELIGDDE